MWYKFWEYSVAELFNDVALVATETSVCCNAKSGVAYRNLNENEVRYKF